MACDHKDERLVEDFWQYFNASSRLVEVECDPSLTGGLATDVLRYYDIPYRTGPSGDLASLDIKRMDAATIIRLSLLEQSAEDGIMYEAIVNDDGEVEFIQIGGFDGNISDRYYTLQTMQYKEDVAGVMVTGAKPRITRKPVVFKLIWCNEEDKVIYDTSHMHVSCMKKDFEQFATIVFNDPHLDSKFEDGIDNLFELGRENPYDSIIGYVYYKDIPKDLISDDTVIRLVDSCKIPLEIGVNTDDPFLPDVGTLVTPPRYKTDITNPGPEDDPSCWVGKELTADFRYGVKVEIPDSLRFETIGDLRVDKFTGISAVYVIGYNIDYLGSAPKESLDDVNKENPTPEDTEILVSINNPTKTVIRLKEGRDYAVAYEHLGNPDAYKIPYIVFANNARPKDTAEYGQVESYTISPSCEAFYEEIDQGEDILTGKGTIIPTGHTTGVLIQQIFVSADIETPAIEIYDPDGENPNGENGKASEIAQKLDFYVGALMVEDKPAPVGFNGDTIDMSQSLRDNDPTTAQNFEDTDYERASDQMQGGGLAINLSFLDGDGDYERSQDQVNTLSEAIYNYMNGTGTKETVYVCGPNCEPRLGGQTSDGIVNEITYSYSDSSSYTISVNVGPRLVGDMAQVDGGPYTKITDNVTLQGTVVQDRGTHVHYKVQIDGFGERLAINVCKDIIRVGDKVNCTIHNCPIEA